MWDLTRLFNSDVRRDDLNGVKAVRVNGHKFKIRKINPLLDFESTNIPQVFSYFQKRRKTSEPATDQMTIEQMVKSVADMKRVIEVGLVWPRLCPEILTTEDIFRWGDTGAKLYLEIITHSLNQFRGLRGVFFSIKIKLWLSTQWRKDMDASRRK